MRIEDYFKNLKKEELSSEKKDLLFTKIQEKKIQKLMTMKHFFSYKKLVYSLITVVIASMVFGQDFFHSQEIENKFFVTENVVNSQVFAWNLAEIIDFNGEFYIQKDEQIFTSKYLQADNILFLKENSELVFNLPDGTKGKIMGPAELVISKNNETYRISLIEGNFLKIYNETSQIELEIENKDVMIETNKWEKTDINIINKEEEVIIDNKGGDIKVNHKKESKSEKIHNPSEIIVNTNRIINIKENDITFVEDNASLLEFIKENNISETFILEKNISKEETHEQIEQEIIKDILSSLSWMIDGNFTGIENENIDWNLQIDNNGKKLLTKEQERNIINLLDDFFLEDEMDTIQQHIKENKKAKREHDEEVLVKEINTIIEWLKLEIERVSSFQDIIKITDQMKKQIDDQFYVGPKYLENLDNLKRYCQKFIEEIEENERWTKNREDTIENSNSVKEVEKEEEMVIVEDNLFDQIINETTVNTQEEKNLSAEERENQENLRKELSKNLPAWLRDL